MYISIFSIMLLIGAFSNAINKSRFRPSNSRLKSNNQDAELNDTPKYPLNIVSDRARILVQVTINRRLLIGRDGHLDQSEAYDIS